MCLDNASCAKEKRLHVCATASLDMKFANGVVFRILNTMNGKLTAYLKKWGFPRNLLETQWWSIRTLF